MVPKPLQGISFLVGHHPTYVRQPGLQEHLVPKALQGINFLEKATPSLCRETKAAVARGLQNFARHESSSRTPNLCKALSWLIRDTLPMSRNLGYWSTRSQSTAATLRLAQNNENAAALPVMAGLPRTGRNDYGSYRERGDMRGELHHIVPIDPIDPKLTRMTLLTLLTPN